MEYREKFDTIHQIPKPAALPMLMQYSKQYIWRPF